MENKIKILSIAGVIAALLIGSTVWVATKKGDATLTAQNITQDVSSTTPKKFTTIKYLYSTTGAYVFEFADELGYLEEEGIRLERAGATTGGPEMIMAVSAGSVDLGIAHWTAPINAIARGTKIRGVITYGGINSVERDASLIVLNDSDINGAKDLKGKKIAVNTLGASYDYLVRTYLKKNGMSIKDVQLVVIPPAQNAQVLRSRQVDVVVTINPIRNMILEGGGAREIEGTTAYEVYDEVEIGKGPVFFGEDFIKENPETVKKFVRATAKAIDWAREHPKEANDLYAKVLKKNQGNPDLAKNWISFGIREHGLITDSDVQLWIDVLENEGKLEKGKFKPSDFYTNEFNPYYKK